MMGDLQNKNYINQRVGKNVSKLNKNKKRRTHLNEQYLIVE